MSHIFLEAEAFEELGGWVIDQQSIDQIGSSYIMAHGMGIPVADARTKIGLKKGVWRVWALTRDWNAPFRRFKGNEHASSAGQFTVLIGGKPLEHILGTNGTEWDWQYAGEFSAAGGTEVISLHDLTGFNGRCDALFLSPDGEEPGRGRDAIDLLRREARGCDAEDDTLYDLIVAGGGVAGICMALAAMRGGSKVLLIQDRDKLGGCNSSDIRVCMGGMINLPPYPALGNVVREIEPIMGDPGLFDAAYYEDDRKKFAFQLKEHPRDCTLRFCEHVVSVGMQGRAIKSVTAQHTITGKRTVYHGRLFADCTGDALIARLAGCEVMYGRDARSVFGEELAPEEHQDLVMGQSIRWYSEETEGDSPFPDIDWGIPLTDETCYHVLNGDWEQETGFRRKMSEETEYIRDYGLLAIYSNWNFQKNRSARKDEYARHRLKWVSPIGGKRESWRVVGDMILTEQDIEEHRQYEDATACMTWSIDMHFPEPRNEAAFGEAFRSYAYHRGIVDAYPVPYRCLYARDVDNLFLGGRDISMSHVAFSAVRVMRTLGALGEAAGLAAVVCREKDCLPREVYTKYLEEYKEKLRQGVKVMHAFQCTLGTEEAYHFKDYGWLYLSPYECENEWALPAFRRGIRNLGLKHKYPFPKELGMDEEE